MIDWPHSSFWQFSLTHYQQPDIQHALLTLQQDFGANVNMLLLCMWVGKEFQVSFSIESLHMMDDVINEWHRQIVIPLRGVRTGIKQMAVTEYASAALSATLRNNILAQEIDAEHVEQLMLEKSFLGLKTTLSVSTDSVGASQRSIAHYLHLLEVPLTSQTQTLVDTLTGVTQKSS